VRVTSRSLPLWFRGYASGSNTITAVRQLPLVILILTACAAEVSVHHVSQEEWYADARRNVLSSGDVSDLTRNMLRRRGLAGNYRQDPESAIRILVEELRESHARNLTVAIAELAYLQTKRVNAYDSVATGTAIRYSYAYLFDRKLKPERQVFDAQFRWASDLYNAALADRLRNTPAENVRAGQHGFLSWYGGSAPISVVPQGLPWKLTEFESVRITRDYQVDNIPRPDVRRGFGVPVVLRRTWDREAALKESEASGNRYLPPFLAFPATLLLRFADGISILDEDSGVAMVRILDATVTDTLFIEGEAVPIEFDLTTPIAAVLTGVEQSHGIAAMRKGRLYERRGGLYMWRPHRAGRIPVLLVHGLASDPYTWLPLYNDLLANETIRQRCEFAFWFYPTGQPILHSAAQLRAAIREARRLFDPQRAAPELEWGVVCGHSMGGLLTRMLVFDSGDALWNAVFEQSIDELDVTPDERKGLQAAFFFEALPALRRVIFFATPHRGSPQAESVLGKFTSSLVALPRRIADPAARLARKTKAKMLVANPTSVRGLRPDNPVLVASMERPIHPRVTYHSIIGDNHHAGATDGTDGFVPYWSSHLDGAASELVLLSDHSVQQTPRAARETLRILLEHIAAYDAARAARVQSGASKLKDAD